MKVARIGTGGKRVNKMAIFKSKKFIVAMGGVIAIVVSHFTGLAEDSINQIVLLIATYLGAQGVADFQKEKAKIEANKE